MSSASDADPADLSLPDLDSDLELGRGPTIDSSDEFPLPSFDGEEEEVGISADVLFPIGGEPTAEEMPAAEPKKQESSKPAVAPHKTQAQPEAQPPELPPKVRQAPPGSFDLGVDEDLADLDVTLTDSSEPLLPSITFDAEPEESLDSDYFEAGLEEDLKARTAVAVKPPKAPLMREAIPTFSAASLTKKQTSAPESGTVPPVTPDFRIPSRPEDSGLTQPGPPQASIQQKSPEPKPESSIDEIFLDAGGVSGKTNAKAKGPVSREDWLEEVPVEKYVRKVKVKRKSSRKPKVRPWVPAIGIAALALAFTASKPLFASYHSQEMMAPVMVVASNPPAEVFSGDELLGKTPLPLSSELAAKPDLQIRKDGYKVAMVPVKEGEGVGDKPVTKFFPTLQIRPVALAWDGYPPDATLWWNGKKSKPEDLAEVLPGDYSLKVKPKSGPSITTSVKIEARAESAGAFGIGTQVTNEFAKQPKAKIALKMPDEKSKAAGLAVTLTSLNKESPYSSKLTLSSSKSAEVALPKAGKYKLSFAGDAKYKATSQQIDLADGATTDVSLALAKQPPKSVVPARPTYRPSTPTYRPTYRPPPRRPYSGGGGGGGRIAPPAF